MVMPLSGMGGNNNASTIAHSAFICYITVMNITKLKTNRIPNPLGFDLGAPIFSWTVENSFCSKSKKQAAAKIEVAADEEFADIIYDSGKQGGISSLGFRPI
jgi:hypothetical protein